MESSRRYDVLNIDVQRTYIQKHLRSENQLENENQSGMILPECLFKEEQAPIEIEFEKKYTILKQ